MKKQKELWTVRFCYNAQYYDKYDEVIQGALGYSDGSGMGMGERDLSYDFDSKAKAEKFLAKAKLKLKGRRIQKTLEDATWTLE